MEQTKAETQVTTENDLNSVPVSNTPNALASKTASNSTKLIIFGAIGILLITASVGASAYYLGTKKTSSNDSVKTAMQDQPTPSPAMTSQPTTTSTPVITVTPNPSLITYTDKFLGVNFSYPSEWGTIESKLNYLNTSDLTKGYIYRYSFSAFSSTPKDENPKVAAGGFSKDLSVPAGTGLGSKGFDQETNKICNTVNGFDKCQKFSTTHILKLSVPTSESMCNGFTDIPIDIAPYATVEINLPNNPKSSGFIFLRNNFVSENERKLAFGDLQTIEVYSTYGCTNGGENPEQLAKAQAKSDLYKSRAAALLNKITNGKADVETMKNYNQIKALAGSITFIK